MEGWGWDKVHHSDHLERVVAFVRQAWAAEQLWELSFPLRGQDGHYRWFLTRAVPIRDEQGELVRWLGTNTDVTETRQLQVQLSDSCVDLETKAVFHNFGIGARSAATAATAGRGLSRQPRAPYFCCLNAWPPWLGFSLRGYEQNVLPQPH